jgi:hypothetical protein
MGKSVQSVLHHALERAEPALSRLAGRVASGPSTLLAQLGHACAVASALVEMFARELRAVTLTLAVYACAFVTLGLIALEFATLPHGTILAAGGPESEWIEVVKPFPAFAMTVPDFEDAARYTSFRHANGGGRRDVLTFGELSSPGATAVIELYRVGAESSADPDDITASIGELRLSTRPTLPTMIDTKFGPVTVESFTDGAPGGERRCLKFLRSFEEPHFELSGWFCNAGQEIVDPARVACALDHLTLVSSGSEPKLAALFARAELRRTFCGHAGVLFAATPKRGDWIEAARDPRLRGRK